MAYKKHLEITGAKAVQKNMERIMKKYGKLYNDAVKEFADDLKPAIEERTPIDTGAMVGTLRRGNDEGDVILSMGGRDVEVESGIKHTQDYTIRQHEDLTLNHPGGGTAKFMELPFLEALPTMTEQIAMKIKTKGVTV